MLRTYKHDGKMWRYEEGEQPEGAVLVETAAEKQTPESRAAKAPAKRRAAAKKAANDGE